MLCPLANAHWMLQPLMPVLVLLVICTCAWKPPGHWLVIVLATLQGGDTWAQTPLRVSLAKGRGRSPLY